MALLCDGIPLPGYSFYSYRKVTSNADGLNQSDLSSLIQILIKYHPEIFTQEIIQSILYYFTYYGVGKTSIQEETYALITLTPI